MSNNVGDTVATSTGRLKISIGELGEFGLIARVTSRLPAGRHTLLGPGDDAAVISAPDGRVVATTDLLVDGRHFRRDWSTPYDVGRKAAAQNMADIAAMGAVPTSLLVGLAAPADLPAFWAERFADGLRDECDLVGAGVVGGDVVRSDALLIAVTALGDLEGRQPVTRAGARVGDVVAFAGKLGWAAAGLATLSRGFRSPRLVVDAHRRPEPPYQAGPDAARAGATSMVDVSDGLIADLGHVATASGVRIELRSSAFAIPDALAQVGAAIGIEPIQWILAGGEDHALVATFANGVALPAAFHPVGTVVAAQADGEVLVDGTPYATGGFDHFK
jgi:thiamine-monophosphate kinase